MRSDTRPACPDPQLVVATLKEPPDSSRRLELERHLDACSACCAAVAELVRGSEGSAAPVASGAEVSAGPLAYGEVFGRYVILERLGNGAMGVVYAARDTELDRRVALKVLRPLPLTETAAGQREARLVREAQALARVTHPHIVTVHEVGCVGRQSFLAMELVEGVSLARWLQERARRPHEVLRVFSQLAGALGAAHDAGLVHRDLKPDNVLISDDGRARLVDFGLVSLSADAWEPPDELVRAGTGAVLSESGQVIGTPAYMAPEQRAYGHASPLTDQFSFFVCLHEALVGVRPPAPSSISPGVPRFARQLLRRGLERVPGARFGSMHEVKARLDGLASRRRRWLSAGAVVALAGGLVATGLISLLPLGAAPSTACRRGSEALAASRVQGARHRAPALSELDRALRGYVVEWRQAYEDACAASVHRARSAAMLERRLRCLDERRAELEGVVAALSEVDPRDLEVEAVRRGLSVLPPLDVCSEAHLASPWDEAQATAQRGQTGSELLGALAAERARARSGVRAPSTSRLRELVARAKADGSRALQAQAWTALAEAEAALGNPQGAEHSARAAVRASLSAGASRLTYAAMSVLADVLERLHREEEAGVQREQLHALQSGPQGRAPRTGHTECCAL